MSNVSTDSYQLQVQHIQMNSPANRLKASTNYPLDEDEYLFQLKQNLVTLRGMLKNNQQQMVECQQRQAAFQTTIQQNVQFIDQLTQQNKHLIHLNSNLNSRQHQLQIELEQSNRLIKRYQMKEKLINNEIQYLSKMLVEKQAVIKYLQSKNQQSNKEIYQNINQPSMIQEMSFHTVKTARQPLSFGKIKNEQIKCHDSSVANISVTSKNRYNQRDMVSPTQNKKQLTSTRLKTQAKRLYTQLQVQDIKQQIHLKRIKTQTDQSQNIHNESYFSKQIKLTDLLSRQNGKMNTTICHMLKSQGENSIVHLIKSRGEIPSIPLKQNQVDSKIDRFFDNRGEKSFSKYETQRKEISNSKQHKRLNSTTFYQAKQRFPVKRNLKNNDL